MPVMTAAPPERRILRAVARLDVGLVLIAVFGLALRMLYVTAPLAEAHRWRQITNADVARNFHEGSFNIFYPRVNWGGHDNAVGMEFPLLHALLAAVYRVAGEVEIFTRLIPIAFSVGTIVAVYMLAVRLFDRPAARAAAFLMAVSPTAVFFGRTFISDTPMLFFSVVAVLGFVDYFQTGRPRMAVLGAVAAGLACLVKVPAVLIFAPIAIAGWLALGWALLRDRLVVVGLALALAATAAWYWHADNIFHETGLGQAIWHASGSYPAALAAYANPMSTVSHWSRLDQLDTAFFAEMLWRTWTLHLTPPGFVLALLGFAVVWRRPGRIVADVWLAAVLALILVSAEGNRWHEFHQLPLLPPAALFFGLAAGPAFDGRWLRATAGRAAPAALGVVLVVAAAMAFHQSGVVPHLYRPDRLDVHSIAAGGAIQRLVPPDRMLVVVEYPRFGNNSPVLLYHARRRGWSLDVESVSPQVLERLKIRFQAAYFATTVWPDLEAERPEVAAYLRAHRAIESGDLPPGVALFQLRPE
jgi:hypothetical protein